MKSKTVYGDLLNLVKKKSGYYKKDIKPILKAFLKVIRAELQKGNRIYIKEFGSFYPQIVKEKKLSNKFTNGEYTIPEHMTYKFKLQYVNNCCCLFLLYKN